MYATLTERDIVRLAHGVRYDAQLGSLVEDARGLTHGLNPSAALVGATLAGREPVDVGRLADVLVDGFEIDRATALADVQALLVELNQLSLANIRGDVRARLRMSYLRREFWAVMGGSWPTLAVERGAPTIGVLVRTIVSRMVPLFAVAALVIGSAVIAGTAKFGLPSPTTVLELSAPAVVLGLFALGVLGHEVAHLVLARGLGQTPLHVVASLGSARVVFRTSGGWRRRATALAGPLAGLLSVLLGAGIMVATYAAAALEPTVPLAAGLAAAAPHLWSLVPWSGDGRQLWTGR